MIKKPEDAGAGIKKKTKNETDFNIQCLDASHIFDRRKTLIQL